MEKSYIEKITAFISNMRDSNEGGDTPGKEGTPFEDEQSYDYAYYNKDLPLEYINNVLESLEYIEGEGGYYAKLFVGTKDDDDWSVVGVSKVDLSIIGKTGYAYMITCSDDSAIMDDVVYLSRDIVIEGPEGKEEYTKGWHTSVEGRLTLNHQPLKKVNQWDKVKTIFSSTPF